MLTFLRCTPAAIKVIIASLTDERKHLLGRLLATLTTLNSKAHLPECPVSPHGADGRS